MIPDDLREGLSQVLGAATRDELNELESLLLELQNSNPVLFAVLWVAYREEIRRRSTAN